MPQAKRTIVIARPQAMDAEMANLDKAMAVLESRG